MALREVKVRLTEEDIQNLPPEQREALEQRIWEMRQILPNGTLEVTGVLEVEE